MQGPEDKVEIHVTFHILLPFVLHMIFFAVPKSVSSFIIPIVVCRIKLIVDKRHICVVEFQMKRPTQQKMY